MKLNFVPENKKQFIQEKLSIYYGEFFNYQSNWLKIKDTIY